MTRPLFNIPFVGLLAKLTLLAVIVVLVVVAAIAYSNTLSLEDSVENLRQSNTDLRVALISYEAKVGLERADIDEFLEKERNLRDVTAELKNQALQLERDWETVKLYKRRIEQSGREIEEIREQIRNLGK